MQLHLALPFITLLLLLLLLHTATSSALSTQPKTCDTPANIDDTCKLVADKDPSVGDDFCVRSLKAGTATMRSFDRRALASVATQLAIDHAMSTEAKVEELMDLESNSAITACFEECLNVYTDAVEHLRNALDNISNQVFARALEQLGLTSNAGDKCAEIFKDAKGSFPLVAVDQDYTKLASIAKAIITSF